MLKQQEVDAEEERLREAVRGLPDEQRKAFYREVTPKLRDPDTYATLNWFFLAGLHHFYLGRWANGAFNLAVFLAGAILISIQLTWLGITLILLVSAWELLALFRSQIIVQDWNNDVYRQALKQYGKQ